MKALIGWCGIVMAFAFYLTPQACHAQETALTDDNIRQFIERTTEVTSRQDENMSIDEIQSYLDDHVSPEGSFKSIIHYNVPGYPTQDNEMTLNKDQFTQSVVDGEKALTNYKTKVKIRKIKIAGDGLSATLETTSNESGDMALQDEDGSTAESIPVDGISACTQVLILSDGGAIQMKSADCKTEITFKSPF